MPSNIHITASELAPRPYIAPNERSISPTTTTSVSPSDMIATELIARSTETPTSMLNDFGFTMNMNSATSSIASTSPPIRNARSNVACPALTTLGPAAVSRELALVMESRNQRGVGRRPFSPCGKRWPEGPEEGSLSGWPAPTLHPRPLSHKGRGELSLLIQDPVEFRASRRDLV